MTNLGQLKRSLSNKFLYATKYIAPPLYRKLCEDRARLYYNKSKGYESSEFGKIICATLAEKFLNEAGHSTEKDDAYKDILGIKGGREEFLKDTGQTNLEQPSQT